LSWLHSCEIYFTHITSLGGASTAPIPQHELKN
jgi:hypothetical protein